MKGRALIKALRGALHRPLTIADRELLADAVEEADASYRAFIESECRAVGDYYDARETAEFADLTGGTLDRAISYLDRRGLIERKAGEPHLVRFVEES